VHDEVSVVVGLETGKVVVSNGDVDTRTSSSVCVTVTSIISVINPGVEGGSSCGKAEDNVRRDKRGTARYMLVS
jgi:hypothetical protein